MHHRLSQPNTHIPEEFHTSYDMCFAAHDAIAQILVSGAELGVFTPEIEGLTSNELETKGILDLVEKLKELNLTHKLPQILVSRVFPTILSDFLHCIFEILEASRKGKLCIAYMLLRKPIQDNLMILESIVDDEHAFAARLSSSPPKFNRGDDIATHTARILSALKKTKLAEALSADYLAKLRYDKNEEDSLDGICNKANHLTTSKSAIKTKEYDLNFIFPTERSMHHQWSYLHSRLPLLLIYTYFLCDHISEKFANTYEEYSAEIFRMLGALYILSTIKIPEGYMFQPAFDLADYFHKKISDQCQSRGYELSTVDQLEAMGQNGIFPSETKEDVDTRRKIYSEISKLYNQL